MPPFRTIVFSTLSVVLLLFCTWVYILQPDFWSNVTVWPVWIWAIPGLLLALMGFSPKATRYILVAGFAWVVYLAVLTEEPYSVIRGFFRPAASDRLNITVVSINCAVGRVEAAMESAQFNPDIVLLQESPSSQQVQQIAKRLFGESGSFIYGFDGSIVSRTKLKREMWSRSIGTIATSAMTTVKGQKILAVSVRLAPVPFRLDLWTSENRELYESRRKVHRRQLQTIVGCLRGLPSNVPIIIGGDFNSPAGDGIFTVWRDRFIDAFCKGGRGWGNTFPNELPGIRIDQIWVTPQIHPVSLRAYRTCYSDHRMIVATLELPGTQ